VVASAPAAAPHKPATFRYQDPPAAEILTASASSNGEKIELGGLTQVLMRTRAELLVRS
jgi:hypothetical protein